MRILILDDMAERLTQFTKNYGKYELVMVMTAADAIHALENMPPFDVVFLDHDLGGEIYCPSDEKSGWTVAEWIRDSVLRSDGRTPKEVIVHTLNEDGRKKMIATMNETNEGIFRIHDCPFAWSSCIISGV